MHLSQSVEVLAVRLCPGADVRRELEVLAISKTISAAAIIGSVGSLAHVCLRYASQDVPTELAGKHEILSLSGMLSQDGVHLHMMVADSQGNCRGGHVVYGCQVYTTLELAIALLPEIHFQRVFDPSTGFKELQISAEAT